MHCAGVCVFAISDPSFFFLFLLFFSILLLLLFWLCLQSTYLSVVLDTVRTYPFLALIRSVLFPDIPVMHLYDKETLEAFLYLCVRASERVKIAFLYACISVVDLGCIRM